MIGLLTSRLAGPIASGVAVLLAFWLGLAQFQLAATRGDLKAARSDLSAAQADLKTCRTNTTALKADIDKHNRAVDALRAEGDAKVAVSAKAASDARSVAESLRRNADRILTAKPGPDLCKSADALILESLR